MAKKYEKVKVIGEGAYGIVFLSVNRETGDKVAIKRFLESDEDPMIRKTAMREIRALKVSTAPLFIRILLIFEIF